MHLGEQVVAVMLMLFVIAWNVASIIHSRGTR